MRIATWNVNSIRQRMDNLQAWLKERQPDIVCLQEIKCMDEAFPREQIEALGYNVAVHGQKTFNGVALLSKLPFDEVAPGLIGDESDVQARFLEAIVSTKTGALRVISLYLPNGNPPDTDKYSYKLNWMTRLINFSHERLKLEEPMVLAGDYNVIPTPADVRRPDAWKNDALFFPRTREKYRALINLGLMGWTGILLSMGTAAISAMAVGIGADYAVYFIFRVREEFQRTGDLREATATALTTSGKAIAYVASAVAGGYLCLTLSFFKVHVLLGVLVALTMVTSSAATLTVNSAPPNHPKAPARPGARTKPYIEGCSPC